MRVGEIIALKWMHVDLGNNMLHIKQSSRLVKEYDEASIRSIPLHPNLAAQLQNHKEHTN